MHNMYQYTAHIRMDFPLRTSKYNLRNYSPVTRGNIYMYLTEQSFSFITISLSLYVCMKKLYKFSHVFCTMSCLMNQAGGASPNIYTRPPRSRSPSLSNRILQSKSKGNSSKQGSSRDPLGLLCAQRCKRK